MPGVYCFSMPAFSSPGPGPEHDNQKDDQQYSQCGEDCGVNDLLHMQDDDLVLEPIELPPVFGGFDYSRPVVFL